MRKPLAHVLIGARERVMYRVVLEVAGFSTYICVSEELPEGEEVPWSTWGAVDKYCYGLSSENIV